MQAFRGGFRLLSGKNVKLVDLRYVGCESGCIGTGLSSVVANLSGLDGSFNGSSKSNLFTLTRRFGSLASEARFCLHCNLNNSSCRCGMPALPMLQNRCLTDVAPKFTHRSMSAVSQHVSHDDSAPVADVVPARIKFKRLDKTAKHIMQILDKEAVSEVQAQREMPDIRPGYVIQLKMEVPENKRRVQVVKGIVIARRNAGLNTTFRLRRLVGGVGVESLFPLYSPNIREIKVLEKKKVKRAKLYYLRDKMNALRK